MKRLFFTFAALVATFLSRAQWESDVRLTDNPYSSLMTMSNSVHAIATSGDTIHVVWYDYRDGNSEIYYKRSIDAGLSWGEDIRLTNDQALQYLPSVSVSGSVVHVSWTDHRDSDYEIYYKRSADGGNNWGEDTRISYHTGNSWHPTMAISSAGILLAWYEAVSSVLFDIFYKRSTDGGLTWGAELQLTDQGSGCWTSLFANGPDIHVAWYDRRDGNREIYYKKSPDGGVTWSDDKRLTNDPAASWGPCIAVHDSVIHVAWDDDRVGGVHSVYYKRSTDGGLTWCEDTWMAGSYSAGFGPSLAVSGSAVHIVWYDDRDSDLEIYYKRSEDEGASWGPDIRLTDYLGESEYPSIAVSGSKVHVVWTDLRDGNEEIYYKRNPTDGYAVGTQNDLAADSGQQFSIYPNPASSRISIRVVDNSKGKTMLTIRNVFGEEFLNKQINNCVEVLDVSSLQNGFYFVSATVNGKKCYNTKLIIAK